MTRPIKALLFPARAAGPYLGDADAGGSSNRLITDCVYPDIMALAKHGATEEVCDVAGCDKQAERSINIKQAARSSLQLKSPGLRSVHLCKEHYKEYKKETKQDREIDQYY